MKEWLKGKKGEADNVVHSEARFLERRRAAVTDANTASGKEGGEKHGVIAGYIGYLTAEAFAERTQRIRRVRHAEGAKKVRYDTVTTDKHSPEALLSALRRPPFGISEEAEEMLRHADLRPPKERTAHELVTVRVGDLGFQSAHVAYEELYARAKELKLELCSPLVALALRHQYTDQLPGYPNRVTVAMKPLPLGNGEKGVFSLQARSLIHYTMHRKAEGLHLATYSPQGFFLTHAEAAPNDAMNQYQEFVFALPNSNRRSRM